MIEAFLNSSLFQVLVKNVSIEKTVSTIITSCDSFRSLEYNPWAQCPIDYLSQVASLLCHLRLRNNTALFLFSNLLTTTTSCKCNTFVHLFHLKQTCRHTHELYTNKDTSNIVWMIINLVFIIIEVIFEWTIASVKKKMVKIDMIRKIKLNLPFGVFEHTPGQHRPVVVVWCHPSPCVIMTLHLTTSLTQQSSSIIFIIYQQVCVFVHTCRIIWSMSNDIRHSQMKSIKTRVSIYHNSTN